MNIVVYLIFALTYLLIASRRLELLPIGRPAGALLGAVLMVVVGALSPAESYHAIDHNTIVLLLGMMIVTVYLERDGFFDWLAVRILTAMRTPWNLLWGTAVTAGLLSAFLVNDTVCLFLTPVIVNACRRAKLPMGPYLIALATSANIGSAATLVGNPQNMIIGSFSGMPFARFLLFSGPAAAVGLAINVALLALYYRKRLPAALPPNTAEAVVDKRRLAFTLTVTGAVIAGFFANLHMGYTALAGAVALIVLDRRDPHQTFARVDWPLLLFFCSLFIVVAGLAKTGVVDRAWAASAPYLDLQRPAGLALFSALMTLGSNLVSNVPMVLLAAPYLKGLASPDMAWVLLAFTTTIAGNFTLIGSVANIIVAERAKEHYHLGFVEYLRFGLVSTALVLATGVTVIYFTMA